MQTKSVSCQRCVKKSVSTHKASQLQNKLQRSKISQTQLQKKFNQLHDEGIKWQRKRQKIRKQQNQRKIAKQLQNCSFHPHTNDKSQFFMPDGSFLKREADWKKSIDKKIESQRQQKQAKQKNKYSFQPKISPTPYIVNKIVSNTVLNKSSVNTKMNTQTSMHSSYCSTYTYHDKKSYQTIYNKNKKLKQKVNETTKPFEHRRLKTSYIENSIKAQKQIDDLNPQKLQKQDKIGLSSLHQKLDIKPTKEIEIIAEPNNNETYNVDQDINEQLSHKIYEGTNQPESHQIR